MLFYSLSKRMLLCWCCVAVALALGQLAQGFVPGQPLPLPTNPDAVCKESAFASFTAHNSRCAKLFWKYKDPDQECCEGLADYFGADSNRTSRNCWCVPEIWDWMLTTSEEAHIEWKTYALACSNKGYIVPFYDEDGETGGYCNGTAPTPEALASATVERPHSPGSVRSVKAWLDSLQNDGLVYTSLIVTIFSAVGVSAMLYPMAYELTMAAKETWAEYRASA